uniref:Uncharacterized protein n=1 Tax=Arundo donax TaxID=35708 RepID=A0A0A8ZYN3_ARUDO
MSPRWFPLQSKRLQYDNVMSAGGCHLQLLLQSVRLRCSCYDCGEMLEYICISLFGKLRLYRISCLISRGGFLHPKSLYSI